MGWPTIGLWEGKIGGLSLVCLVSKTARDSIDAGCFGNLEPPMASFFQNSPQPLERGLFRKCAI